LTARRSAAAAWLVAAGATALLAPSRAAATDLDGLVGVEIGGGYANAAPKSASNPSALLGGAVRARISYGLTDAVGLVATGQIAWLQPRRPIVEVEYEDESGALVTGAAYGAEITRTRLQSLGLGIVYALDVLRVIPFLSAGIASVRAVEAADGEERVDYDAALWFEAGADWAIDDRFRIGASAIYDVLLAGHAELTADVELILRASVSFGPAKVGRR
jgi:hypothetical protein